MTSHGEVMEWARAKEAETQSEAQGIRKLLNAVLQQHVLYDVGWVERPWPHDISDSFALYLADVTAYMHRRLGTKLFFRWPFEGTALRKLRAARVVAEEYWRATIPQVDFGNDLAHAIEHFQMMVNNHLEMMLGDFPIPWLPFIFEVALDSIGAERYANAIRLHLDVITTIGSRKATFAYLHDYNIHDHYELMSYAASKS